MLLGNIQKAVDTGFPRIKLKTAPGWDLDMLKAVTSTFPKMTFHIDCNSGYTLDDLPFFKAIDDMGLAFIEQPLYYADVLDHAELARQIQTPVCLDETIVSVKAAEQAVQVGAAQYINIKPGRIGGLGNAAELHLSGRPVSLLAILHARPVGSADGAHGAPDVRAVHRWSAAARPRQAGRADGAVEDDIG